MTTLGGINYIITTNGIVNLPLQIDGGYECPSATDVQTEECQMAACNCYCPEV